MGLNMHVVCEDGRGAPSVHDLRVVGRYLEQLDKIAKKERITLLAPFVIDPEAQEEEDTPPPLLDPQDAIRTFQKLAQVLKDTPKVAAAAGVDDIDGVLEEIPEYVKLLQRAAKRKKRVCFMFV